MFPPLLIRATRAGGAFALLVLAGCTAWNDRDSRFATYADFVDSPLASNGQLPSNLMPRSARNIRVHYNIDTTEVEAEFDFAAVDEELMQAPFLSPGMTLHRQMVREGQVPAPAPVDSDVLVRCGAGAVEFLKIDKHTHARYWTSWDKQLRATTCPRVVVGASSA